jgi:hypothetical protein
VTTFAHEIEIDGLPYTANRVGLARGIHSQYIPLVAGQQPSIQEDPVNYTTWHRGSLAGRKGIPGMIHWGKNVWTVDPGMLLPGPLVTTVALPAQPTADLLAWGEQDGHIYVAGGATVYRLPLGDGPAVTEQALGVGAIATSIKKFGNSLFVGRSDAAAGSLWEKPSGAAWTQALLGANPVYRGRMTTVVWTIGSITQERLVAEVPNAATPSVQYTTGAPRNDANWGPVIPVGSFPVTDVFSSWDHVYISTTGGLRDLDSSGLAPNLTPEAEMIQMSTNGIASLAAGGFAYTSVGYGLLRLRVVTSAFVVPIGPQPCGPGAGQVLPNESPVAGYFTDLMRYRSYIIGSQFDATTFTTYVSWAREANQDEPGPLTWFVSPIVLDGLKVTSMWISGLLAGNPRLWMATVTAGGTRALAWAPLAIDTPYGDLRSGRAYRFAQSYQVDLPTDDDGDDTMPKYLPEALAEGEALSGGSNIAVSLAADGDSAYQPLGTFRTSPRSTVRPLTPISYYRRTVRLVGTGTVTVPPVLRRLTMRPMPRADTRLVKTYQLNLGRAVRSLGGNLDGMDPEDRKLRLERLQRSLAPVTFKDENGRWMQAIVASGITYAEVESSEKERVETATVSLAILQQRGTGFKWGSGVKYGTVGRVWG